MVFLGFAAGHSLGIKEFGLALAIAVTVDATVVRCIPVPATMTLLGHANWWAPKPLQRMHQRFGLHEARTSSDTYSAVDASGPTTEADAALLAVG